MPHAAIIAAAITAGVGTAVAFEVGVFRPWREVNWPNGIAQGLKQEWQEFSEDMKDGFREISGDLRRQRQYRRHQEERSRGRRDSDAEEEIQLRREMDEFSLHEAQSSGLKSRYTSEFGVDAANRRRNLQGATSEDDLKEDVHLARTSYIDHLDSSPPNMQDEGPQASVYHDTSNALSPVIAGRRSEEASRETTAAPTFNHQADSLQQIDHNDVASQQSPSSLRHVSIQDDWQSQLSFADTNETRSEQADHDDEDSGSASWVQLTDSRPNSPWSDTVTVERR